VLAASVIASPPSGACGIAVRDGKVDRLILEGELPPTGEKVLDFRPHFIGPGTIDVHTHGAVECSFSSGPAEDTLTICRYRAITGATGLLATITGVWDELLSSLEKLGRLTDRPTGGADLLGIHVEGPFLNPERRGAIDQATMRPPTVDDLHRMQDAAGGAIRMMTVAPELPGALPVIEAMVRLGIVPSAGHSDATYGELIAGIEAGVRKSTHTFNAMRPLHHREPGTVGAILSDSRITAELIPDGVHVHPAVAATLIRTKGAGGVALVTDGVRYSGLADGIYERMGRGRAIVKDGVAVTEDGTIAGSVSPMNRNMRVLRDEAGITLDAGFEMAAQVPAALLGLTTRGRLTVGNAADFAVYREADLTCVATFIRGVQVFGAPG